MKTNSPKIIGIVMLLVGAAILGFWGNGLYKTATYPFTGITSQARIIGYKVSANGARMVKSNKTLSGKSPYFEFVTANKDTIKKYSKSPQVLILFNYDIEDKVTIAYPKNQPSESVIISWKEFPGILLMLSFGVVIIVVGKSYLFKK